jgi:Ser/Thr protein kinase RdoA (MazF antagonist)
MPAEELVRLRRRARTALAAYGLADAPLRLLQHEHNTTYRVDAAGGPFVLRIARPGVHTPATTASELAWLRALREETELGVPEPVAARDGALTVVADGRVCVLLRWVEGRFVAAGLQPGHMRQVARLHAALHEHTLRWRVPDGFARPRVDALTSAAKAACVRDVEPIPAEEDGRAALALIEEHAGPGHAETVASALAAVRAATGASAASTLIHGDLHTENVLFKGGTARAIDFDDCGWGLLAYDLAVTVNELRDHPRYAQLRHALLDEYARHRPLPPRIEEDIEAFWRLRLLQLIMWMIESREHPGFRDRWRGWVRADLAELARLGSAA